MIPALIICLWITVGLTSWLVLLHGVKRWVRGIQTRHYALQLSALQCRENKLISDYVRSVRRAGSTRQLSKSELVMLRKEAAKCGTT